MSSAQQFLACADGMSAVNRDHVVGVTVEPTGVDHDDSVRSEYNVVALLSDGTNVVLWRDVIAVDGGTVLFEFLDEIGG